MSATLDGVITTAQWRRAIRPALDSSDSWVTTGKLTYRTPVDWVLLGVHGEGSGVRADEVYVSVLTMPLFVPADHVTLNHARRVPTGTATFALANDDLGGALTSAIAQVPTQSVALEAIADSASEESAYAALLLDRSDVEERLVNDFAPGDHRSFVEVSRDRRRSVLDTLQSSGPDQAKQLLREWRDATVSALGVA